MFDSNTLNPPPAPVEVWQAIFDNLDSELDLDKRTLVDCSLSCKTFLPLSYRRLYYHITLASSASAEHFIRTIRAQSQNQPTKYVRCLSIYGYRISESLLNSIIPVLAQSLPAVSILCLDHMFWPDIDQPAHSALITGFQTVRRLRLSEVIFYSEDPALELIASFPSLTHLTRQHHRGPNDYLWTMASPQFTPLSRLGGLKVLNISSDYAQIFHDLLRLGSHPELHTLRINFWMRYDEMGPVGRLLDLLGPSLESLTFSVEADLGWGRPAHDGTLLSVLPIMHQFDKLSSTDLLNGHPINLAKNTNLRTLTLHCGTCFGDVIDDGSIYDSEYQRPVSWALSLLSQIASPQVSEFKLRMVVGGTVSLSRVDWPLLDKILSKPLWRHGLKRAVVDIVRSGHMPLAAGDIDSDCVRLSLPMIATFPSVSLTIKSSNLSEVDGYV